MTDVTFFELKNDGDEASVVFLASPEVRYVVPFEGRYLEQESYLAATSEAPPVPRLAFNVALYGSGEVQILDVFPSSMKSMWDMSTAPGARVFVIRRQGTTPDGEPAYLISLGETLTDEEKTKFGALPVHDLRKVFYDRRVAYEKTVPASVVEAHRTTPVAGTDPAAWMRTHQPQPPQP